MVGNYGIGGSGGLANCCVRGRGGSCGAGGSEVPGGDGGQPVNPAGQENQELLVTRSLMLSVA